MLPKQKPHYSRHVSATSVDTNASAIAESTISLGLGRFPEPPSSIPSTPLHSNFNNSPSSSIRNFPSSSLPPVTPLRGIKAHARPNDTSSSAHFPQSGPSPRSINQSAVHSPDPSQPSSSSHIISAHDWHDGASSIDVDAAEDRLLPTSFITSLLTENQNLRKSKRTSYGSDAFSGISEMTYPPLVNRSANVMSNFPDQHRFEDPRPPPTSYPSCLAGSYRISGDSDTLHSLQAYPPIVARASVVKVTPGTRSSVIEVPPATSHGMSNSSQISSTRDSDTIGSTNNGYQRKLSTAYETNDEYASDYKGSYTQATTYTGTERRFLRENLRQDHVVRDSLHSHQSTAPSFISRISGLSLRRVFAWRKKPLPPVPRIPDISIAAEHAHRKEDEAAPLPDLINRAGVLRDLLDRGHPPHHSMSSYQVLPAGVNPSMSYEGYEAESRKLGNGDMSHLAHLSPLHKEHSSSPAPIPPKGRMTSKRKRVMWALIIVVVVLIAVGVGVGVALGIGKKKSTEFNCTANLTGSSCNLDSSCVCTTDTSLCNGLAQSIVDILPAVNQAFDVNITSASAYNSIWIMQGSPTTRSCDSQALLIDVGSNLNIETYPNRTRWAQAALLWNAMQTQDMTSVQRMQTSVQALPWKKIASSDGPVGANSEFSITSSGFDYNFAAQSLSQPSGTFATLGQPPSAQIAQVSPGAKAALDRMYSYAQASATQRQTALQNYWKSVLLRRPEDLAVFKTAISVSPIMLPFNASSSGIRNIYVSSPSSSFPPPLSCFPGLSSSLLQSINTLESTVFGLQNAPSVLQFDPQCYPERPIYGVLDILRLRLPFSDSHAGVNRQALALTRDASSRAVLYSGQIFSATSDTAGVPTTITPIQLNPRQYGTLRYLDHVILQYLTSITDINIANALIQFVLNTANNVPVPPDPTSLLFQSLSILPTLEVAVFGDIQSLDITSTFSSFTTQSGALFFGSPDGSALRNWTINSSSGTILWTQNATSPLIAHDTSLDPSATISRVWNAASSAIAANITNVSLTNVTVSLQATNSFSPQ